MPRASPLVAPTEGESEVLRSGAPPPALTGRRDDTSYGAAPSAAALSSLATLVGHDDPETARMLTALYGRPKPSAAPPVPRQVEWRADGVWQRPMHAGEAARDPRLDSLDREAMAVVDVTKPPAVVVREVHVPAIDTVVGHRRSAAAIAAAVAAGAVADAETAAPPLRRGYNTEVEKRSLQTRFALKGGHALPDVAMPLPVAGEIPMHLLTGTRRTVGGARGGHHDGGDDDGDGGSAAAAAAIARAGPDGPLLAAATPDELALLAECASTARELAAAIDDLRAHATELASHGALPPERAAAIDDEIALRVRDRTRIASLVATTRDGIARRLAAHGSGGGGGGGGGGGSGVASGGRGGVSSSSGSRTRPPPRPPAVAPGPVPVGTTARMAPPAPPLMGSLGGRGKGRGGPRLWPCGGGRSATATAIRPASSTMMGSDGYSRRFGSAVRATPPSKSQMCCK